MDALFTSGIREYPRMMQEVAIFFARYRIAGEENAYLRLLRGMPGGRDGVRLASLNYETLLEQAAAMSGAKLDYWGHGGQEGTTIIWKPHGSCHFLPAGGTSVTRGVTYRGRVSFGTGIRPCDPHEVATYCNGNTALYPAMAVYARGKPLQVAPEPLRALQQKLSEAVLAAKKVFVVGVHPNPDDSHLWDAVARTDAALYYVGNERAFRDWTRQHRGQRQSHFMGADFASIVPEMLRLHAL
jgi:hypothetical protein